MTKLKNTKKGMAKKALSISLVAAMLATSNVPVWAADVFDDGSNVAVETEAPVDDVNTFSSEEAPVTNDVAPAAIVEEETEKTAITRDPVVVGSGYNVTMPGFKIGGNALTNNEAEWDSTVTADVTVEPTADAVTGATLHAIWKDENGGIDGTEEDLTASTSTTMTITPTAQQTNTQLSLYVYAMKDGQVVWNWTSDAFTVKPKNIATVLGTAIPAIKNTFNNTYTGKDVVPTIDDIDFTALPTGFSSSDFTIGSTEGDTVNVTDKGVDVYLSVNKTGYAGSIVLNYGIAPLDLTTANVDQYLGATFVKTSTPYTGNSIVLTRDDVKVVDKKSGVDLSSYIKDDNAITIDKPLDDKLKDIDAGTQYNTGKAGDGTLTFKVETPAESTYKNYTIPAGGLSIAPSNVFTITKRNLSSVNVIIPEKAYQNGNIVTVKSDEATYVDKDTNEPLDLSDDVVITSTASTQGVHTVTVSPDTNNTNVEGSTTAELSIAASSLATAVFSNMSYAQGPEAYTGERILKDISKLGTVSVTTSTGSANLTSDDYTIEFGTNINAGTNAGVIIIRGLRSYVGSTKKINFTINPAEVKADTVTVNKFVEKKDTTKPSDYKEAMGLVVKAKNANGKEFTLAEGTDYVIDKYEFIEANSNADVGGIGDKVRVTLKATVAGLLKNTNFKATQLTFESTITKTALKDENIKLKKTSYTYTGAAISPDFDVVVDGRVIPPTEYRIKSLTGNVNAGTATMVITGNASSSYSDDVDAKATFTVTAEDASKLSGVMPSVPYTGYSIQPAKNNIHVKLNDVEISVNDNFNVTYGENINVGDATIILTPKNNNFTGTKTITFKITGKMLADGALKYYDANGLPIAALSHTFNGSAYTAAKTVFDSTSTTLNTTGKAGKLTEGTDYEIKYVDNVYGKKITTATGTEQRGIVLVIAKGSYAGNYTNANAGVTDGIYTDANGNKTENIVYAETFVIGQKDVARSNVSVKNATYAGGLPTKPVVVVNVEGRTLVEGIDYDLDLTGNNDLANVTATNSLSVQIVPKNGYEAATTNASDLTFKWGIDKFDLANAEVSVDGDNVTVKCGRVDVTTDNYTVTKNAEKDTVTVTATKDSKNYKGSKTVNAVIVDPEEKPVAPTIQQVNVVGNKATVVLEGNTEGSTGYDYVISTSKVFTDKASRVGVNANVLSTQTTFHYVDQGVYYAYLHSWKRGADGKKVFSEWSNAYPFVVSSITPDQPTVTSVKVSGKKVTVTYTKTANATGYDLVLGSKVKKVNGEKRPVEYGKLVKKVYKGNTVTATFTNVPKGTYYAGLHAYNRTSENNGKVFSPWSNTKKVTVK